MTMTQEQNERWQKTILPMALGVLDGHEMTPNSLFLGTLWHQDIGVPGWADHLRSRCISLGGGAQSEHWVPEFTLRSELYLMGLQLLYPASSNSHFDAYKRVLLRFFHEALAPFEQQARESDDGRAYGAFALVRRFCENGHAPILEQEWTDALSSVSAEYHLRKTDNSKATNSLINLLRSMLRDWHFALLRPNAQDSQWYAARNAVVADLIGRLNRQHQWRVEGNVTNEGEAYTCLIAQAYLIALESECPAPDWLPRV